MCGIAAIVNRNPANLRPALLTAMSGAQQHRGPDADGEWISPSGFCGLAHRRLSILDLSDAGRQPMVSRDGRYHVTYNGEIYNYLELRQELGGADAFRTGTDTEVLLAAYARWGEACLHRLIGMFAFAIWDEQEKVLFAARDRFGVKPVYLHETAGGLWIASEIKAFHAAGVPREPDAGTWARYLRSGMYEDDRSDFWIGVRQVPAGGYLKWTPGRGPVIHTWYDPAAAALFQGEDQGTDKEVGEALLDLLEASVRLRFRSDVPVGICLSGGLDSSLLLGLVHRIQGADSEVKTFTFYCNDPAYDETPWVEQMLLKTRHPASYCRLRWEDVPLLAPKVQAFQDAPFGGIPTLGMAKVHERARSEGVTVLLDGNGVDEGWAGYDYYQRAATVDHNLGPVQGSRSSPTRSECLRPEFAALAEALPVSRPFGDALRDLQYRDLRFAKIPRAMRFADRVSMMYSRELREPFLDHCIVEMGLTQPQRRKIRNGQGKWLVRQCARQLLPEGVREAPKRPVQTPQREWLRGPLASWAEDWIEVGLAGWGKDWLDADATRKAWKEFRQGHGDNSFAIWQWISLGMMQQSVSSSAASEPERTVA